MAFQGFGKNSGPSAPPSAQTPFGYFPRPPAPSPTPPPLSSFPRQPSPRVLEAPDSTRSPPLAFESNYSVLDPSYPSARGYRPTESPPAWGDRQNSFFKDYNTQTQQRPAGASFVASRNFRAGVPAPTSQFQELGRTNSPPLRSNDEHISRNSRTAIGSRSDLLSNNRSQPVPKRSRSPPFTLENNRAVKDFGPFVEAQGPDISPPAWTNQQKLPGNFANSQPLRDQFPVSPDIGTYDSAESFLTKRVDSQVQKRTRSPPLLSANEVSQKSSHFAPNDSKRTSASTPSLRTMSNVIFNAPDSQIHRESLPSARITDGEAAVTKATNISVPKRTRSPPLSSTDQVFQGDYYSAQDDIERELQAKAKRLARFKVELSEPVQSGIGNEKISANKSDHSMVESQKFRGVHSEDMVGDFPNGNVSSDFEAPESSRIISGLCPDMCPESERAERERKGDLDQYERVDGDRNQTSTSLAVKKYTRTAEREADLIRPMPVLQRTIDYLLNLLDQPYDEKLLGLYNFLWDRMRAIRMDLRMQHIFNLGAITMLEQMIRLHIIAMHELCEYTKGEGFSEGFDAHLNIEQMNKTSVELFQLYDDHRKKGIKVPTEKEFRGYYALLKLDKHPGYKVEPAELSLDLSKMTPEIRQTSEVLFARDVARACRTGNFVSFFRCARKASYLQACLLHAHFSKLRTQALASLHCGLQNNQGVPVTNVAKWLGMEEEDIENLLEYHGFSIKEFEEPYMVKDGPFLNSDNDYPVKCSELVHLKKSRRIVEDVSSPCLATEEIKELKMGGVYEQEVKSITLVKMDTSVRAIDEEMSDYDAVPSPKDTTHGKPMLKIVADQSEAGDQMASVSPFSWDFSMVHNSPESQPPGIGSLAKPQYDTLFRNSLERNIHSSLQPVPLESMSRRVDQERFPGSQIDSAKENLVPQSLLIEDGEEEEEELTDDEQHTAINQNAENDGVDGSNHDEEAAEAKLRLILRIWKRRSSKKREIREQRQLAANAALDSLSLGPPIRHNKYQRSTHVEFDMDRAMKERYKKHVQSWSRLNVSEVIAGKLGVRNPKAKCLCWKIILHSQMDSPDRENMGAHLTPSTWLLSKLMPARKDADDNDDMVISSPGLSIWKKWVPSQSSGGLTCCLSVIRDAKMNNLNESVSGVNAVLFLVSESIPWDLQKIRLHNLIRSLPSGSCLPLLIVSGSYKENPECSSTMVEKLSLHDIDKSRISNFLVVCLVKNQHSENFDEFFSDERLREGLEWLASLSPLQPVLSCIKTRDLVLNHLNSSLGVLDEMGVYEVGANHCISSFNEALDQSLREVTTAAEANCVCWPCPEIALLEEYSDEHRAVNLYLPNIGWSSAARIQPLMCALRDCKLPMFPDDISWLYRGSNSGEDIKSQRLQLENCLIKYLVESSKMMGLELATKEACVMLQNSARLELHDLTHYIVPNWVTIFRRVLNWRLMSLSNGPFPTAYILEQHDIPIPISGGLDEWGLESSISSPYYVIHPSLDEMVEALMSPTDDSESEALQPPLMMLSNAGEVQKVSDAGELMDVQRNIEQDDKLAETSSDVCTDAKIDGRSGELAVATRAGKEADKLSKLLEQCNIMQDMIDTKLSIYF